MTITYQSASTLAYGSTSVAANYPASLAAKEAIILLVGTKPDTATIATPTGFTKLGEFTGGTGVVGADTGPVKQAAFVRIATGAETGTLTVSITSGSASWAQMFRYTATSGRWNFGCTGGSDATAGTAWSVTGGINPGITAGDDLLVGSTHPTDVGAGAMFASESITATSATIGSMTELSEPFTATGNQVGGFVFRMTCSAGTASATPVITGTASGTTTNVAGASILVRLREVSAHSQELDDFEGGTSGNSYTTTSGISDAGSGGATITYQSAAAAQKNLGVRFAGGSGVIGERDVNVAAPNVNFYCHAILRVSAIPSANTIALAFGTAATIYVDIQVTTGGLVRYRDNAVQRFVSSTVMGAAGPFVQIAAAVVNGQLLGRIYDASGTLLESESTLNGTYTAGALAVPLINQFRFGCQSNPGLTTNFDFDWVGYSTDDWVTPLYLASGPVVVVANTSGTATTINAAAGVVDAVANVVGDATRVTSTPQAAGVVDVVSNVVGDATRVPLTLAAAGTVPVVANTVGNATRVLITAAAAGVVPVVANTVGSPTRVPVIGAASGTVACVTNVSGSPTTVLGAAATNDVGLMLPLSHIRDRDFARR